MNEASTIRERHLDDELTLLELLDRLLDNGVVLSGDITLSVADVDLVYVGLRLLLSSAETAERLEAKRAEDAEDDLAARSLWEERQ